MKIAELLAVAVAAVAVLGAAAGAAVAVVVHEAAVAKASDIVPCLAVLEDLPDTDTAGVVVADFQSFIIVFFK